LCLVWHAQGTLDSNKGHSVKNQEDIRVLTNGAINQLYSFLDQLKKLEQNLNVQTVGQIWAAKVENITKEAVQEINKSFSVQNYNRDCNFETERNETQGDQQSGDALQRAHRGNESQYWLAERHPQ
jgi:hypothetical protein